MSPWDILGWVLVAAVVIVLGSMVVAVIGILFQSFRVGWRKQRDHARAIKGQAATCGVCENPAQFYTESGPRCVKHMTSSRRPKARYSERIAA